MEFNRRLTYDNDGKLLDAYVHETETHTVLIDKSRLDARAEGHGGDIQKAVDAEITREDLVGTIRSILNSPLFKEDN